MYSHQHNPTTFPFAHFLQFFFSPLTLSVLDARCRLLLKHAKLDERPVDEDGNEIDIDESGLQLTQFEMAQLANLCITEVDEAKALIPTLATRDDALLDSLLQELDNIRRFS